MIAKVFVVLFQIIPLIILCFAFLIGATYLQVMDEQEQNEVHSRE